MSQMPKPPSRIPLPMVTYDGLGQVTVRPRQSNPKPVAETVHATYVNRVAAVAEYTHSNFRLHRTGFRFWDHEII